MHELSETSSGATAVSAPIPPYEDRQLVKWIERQSQEAQDRISRTSFEYLLEKAAQPRHASSNACIKLCYFLDQCRSSKSTIIRDFVFSEKTCLDLFNFYIEWNEKNQNRSMRQVLEFVSSLVVRNPSKAASVALKAAIAERTLAIITHQAAQPLVKPAFKCLEYLIGKGTISVQVLVGSDDGDVSHDTSDLAQASWDDFFSGTFEWMVLPDVSPAAGKFLVTVFRVLKDQQAKTTGSSDFSASWQRWISKGLDKNPESLENVKNYLFSPLFKLDRAGSVIFLEDLNTVPLSTDYSIDELDAQYLLRLSAMEQGKKAGLIEEPATLDRLVTGKKTSAAIVLSEDTLRPLVFHASDTVRSLAFSVLISALSSIRPFSSPSLNILKSCMGILYSDPDAKIRNEVLSNTKHMIERLRGATSFMAREVETLTYQPQELDNVEDSQKIEQDSLRGQVSAVLDAHRDFLTWYLEFLLEEMIPTASYQRHITALRATILLLQSGLHMGIPKSKRVSGNATAWPFSVYFFTPRAVRLLLDLLLDPFEDVRSTAADILRLASSQDFDKKATLIAATPGDLLQAMEIQPVPNASQTMLAEGSHLAATPDVDGNPSQSLTLTLQNIIPLAELSKKNERMRQVQLSDLAEPLNASTTYNNQHIDPQQGGNSIQSHQKESIGDNDPVLNQGAGGFSRNQGSTQLMPSSNGLCVEEWREAPFTDTNLSRRVDQSIEGDSYLPHSRTSKGQQGHAGAVDTKLNRGVGESAQSEDLTPSQTLGDKEQRADTLPSNKQDLCEQTRRTSENIDNKDTLQANNGQCTGVEERADVLTVDKRQGQGETEQFLASGSSSSIDLKKRSEDKSLGILLEFIDNAKSISRHTGRADYADGLARSYELLYALQPSITTKIDLVSQLIDDLEEKLQVAENNLGQAVLAAPIHGNFAALRFIWDSPILTSHETISQIHDHSLRPQLDTLQLRLTKACIRIWQAVKEILCNDSPEGLFLEDLDDVDTVDTKNILSYSFRAVHESSNLLRSLLSKIKIPLLDGAPLLPLELFEQIGDLSFDQLSNLRHRGAFSTVSLTFTMCCILTQYTGPGAVTKMDHMLKKWYDKTLDCVNFQTSTTRRSAGIPSLVTGIMAAKSLKVAFPDIMHELMKIAWREVQASEHEHTNLSQVHAINSLKEAFKSSALGSMCEPYMGNCLQIAVHSLRSEVWAVRNSGLILLRSLIDVLFGTNVSKGEIENGWDGRSVKIQYDKYPELVAILYKMLDCTDDSEDLSQPDLVLPALDILRRAGPPPGDSALLLQKVMEQLKSPVWKIREMAGRAFCALTLDEDFKSRVVELITNTDECANVKHGSLLAVRYIIERRSMSKQMTVFVLNAYQDIDVALKSEIDREFELEAGPRPFIVAELYQCLNAILSALLAASDSLELDDETDLAKDEKEAFEERECPEVFRAYLIQVILEAALQKDFDMILKIVKRLTPETDSDTILALLPSISMALKSDSNLGRIVLILGDIYLQTSHADIRAAVLCNLSQVFENKYDANLPQEQLVLIAHKFHEIEISWSLMAMVNPMFHNAWINFSGWIMVVNMSSAVRIVGVPLSERLRYWAEALKASGQAQNDFDSRLAAVKGLQALFSHLNIQELSQSRIVPVLFVLYDILNDDDSEIRIIGAKVVSRLARVSLNEMAAADWLSGEMLRLHRGSSEFVSNVVHRMAGSDSAWKFTPEQQDDQLLIQSLESQLKSARSKDDGLLFNVEKANLYIDEVRELHLWSEIFEQLPQGIEPGQPVSPWESEPINRLLRWTHEGLVTIIEMYNVSSRHWQSDPVIFTASMRVIVCTRALYGYQLRVRTQGGWAEMMKGYASWNCCHEKLRLLWQDWADISVKRNPEFHPSLLEELLKRQPRESFFGQWYRSLVFPAGRPIIGPRYGSWVIYRKQQRS